MRRFDRDTTWLAMGVLGALILATLFIGVQELSPKRDNLTEASQAQNNLLLNGKPATRFTAVDVSQESSNEKTIPEQPFGVDHGYKISYTAKTNH